MLRLCCLIASLLLTLTATIGSADTRTQMRILEPGDNLVGWVGEPTSVVNLFEVVPRIEVIYLWDAPREVWRFAAPAVPEHLWTFDTVEPGMGIVIRIGGNQAVEWSQEVSTDGELVPLHRGANLVAWTGPNNTPLDLAIRPIAASVVEVHYQAHAGAVAGTFIPDGASELQTPPSLERGDGLWLMLSESTQWVQPSGDRPPFALTAPPQQLGVDPFYQKYLNADGVVVVSSQRVPDEALFRAVAIFDDMLTLRPDIRDTWVRLGNRVVVMANTERLYHLPELRWIEDLEDSPEKRELRVVRGLGPTHSTPVVVPEELIWCDSSGNSVTVHEFAHAIHFALNESQGGSTFNTALFDAYRDSLASGLIANTYADRNHLEYWAVFAEHWLRHTVHSNLIPEYTHEDLVQYFPGLAPLLQDVFGSHKLSSTCRVDPRRHELPALEPHYMLSGQIRQAHGAPREEIEVGLFDVSRKVDLGGRSARTDGSFAFLVRPGDYTFRVQAMGCDVYYGGSAIAISRQRAGAFTVSDADRVFRIELPAGFCSRVVRGSVVGADGVGLNDIQVWSKGEPPLGFSWATSDSDGRWRLTLQTSGNYHFGVLVNACTFYHSNGGMTHKSQDATLYTVEDAVELVVEMKVPADACRKSIAGTLLDADGEPGYNTTVGYMYADGSYSGRLSFLDGAYEFSLPIAEEFVIFVESEGCRIYFGRDGWSQDRDDASPFVPPLDDETIMDLRLPEQWCEA